jgi:predicted kinase
MNLTEKNKFVFSCVLYKISKYQTGFSIFVSMNKPLLVIITGMPASGKTTLAHQLSKETRLPLLSRDELKEGYINTAGISHNEVHNSVAIHIYKSFFETAELLLSKEISIIVEAAFQDKLWRPKLTALSSKAAIKIIICKIDPRLANERFTNRLSNDPGREKYHGDNSFNSLQKNNAWAEKYDPVKMDVPTLEVDTTENYKPSLEKIIQFIGSKNT